VKQRQPHPGERLHWAGVVLALILLIGGVLSGVFYISESTPVPSGSAIQTEAFLPGPYLSVTWVCPTGYACPSTSFSPYGQFLDSAILPSLPQTGLLYLVLLVPLMATLVVGIWFLITLTPRRLKSTPPTQPSPRLLGAAGALSIAAVTLALLLTPALLASDLKSYPSGVPAGLGPWNSPWGTSTFGHLTLTWGPGAGFYLILVAGTLLVAIALLQSRRLRT